MTRKLTLLTALFLIALLPATASAYLPAGFFGISPQSAGNAKDFELMEDAGIDRVRLLLSWASVEPVSPYVADPDWSGFDREVELAAESRMRIMPFVLGSPDWVAAEGIQMPVETALQRRAWSNFLRAAAERYGSFGSFWTEHPDLPFVPIHQWEIWNEPNIIPFASDPDPVKFAQLVRISGRALHGADPGTQVILGGLFGRPLQVPPNVASGDFLQRFYRAGNVKPFFDGVALHPYVARAEAMGGQIENLRRIMRSHADSRTPLYITELGWGSNSGPSRWERGLQGQADQLSQAFEMLAENRQRWRIGGAWWFTWTDEGGSCQFCDSAGLLTPNRRAKPAWYRFNAWTGGDAEAVPRALSGDLARVGSE